MTTPFAALSGLILTLALGFLTKEFLNMAVSVELPARYNNVKDIEPGGGGSYLGHLERLLFFVAFWLEAYVLIVGWLAFKVAAKWAAWQHVVRIPESTDSVEDNMRLSSHLLGRFLLGTLYNVFCAAVGFVIGKFVFQA